MTTTTLDKPVERYLAAFETFERQRRGRDAFLAPIRKAAVARLAGLGFPTTRHEDWRFTNIAPLTRMQFAPANPGTQGVRVRDLTPYLFGDAGILRLVFVNGRFAAELSELHDVPAGLAVGSLAEALEKSPQVLEPHLARYVTYQDSVFAALNTAFLEDGAYVHVPRGRIVERPIHLLFVSTAAEQPTVSHPRNLIVAEEGSQVTLVESYVGLGQTTRGTAAPGCAYFTNPVTELIAGAGAVVDHCKVQRELESAFHFATLRVHTLRSATLASHSIALGGALVRNDVHAVLEGEGCDVDLNGLFVTAGSQHVDNFLRVEHVGVNCNSREFYKGILDGRSHGVFTGRIKVHKGAQKTDAKQTNRNLLLSAEAQVDTKPQLEIFADDVKCTHGATIGQLDADALFYLRVRGINLAAARSLLIYAFAGESMDQVKLLPLRTRLHELVVERLPQGELLRELV